MDKKTKRLGNRATQRELKEAHMVKMGMKKALNEHNRSQVLSRPTEHVFANLSKNHPSYGSTPAQDSERKIALDSEAEV